MYLQIHCDGAPGEVEEVVRSRPHQTIVFQHALLVSRTHHHLLPVDTSLLGNGSPQAAIKLLGCCALPHI